MTERGRFTLALGLGTYLAAWAFGAGALYAPAVGLVLISLAALGWTQLLSRPLRLSRSVDRDRPLEGDDVVIRVDLRSDGGVLPGSVVLHDVAGSLGERDVVVPRDGNRLRTAYRVEGVPRGRYRFTGALVSIEDPFGLAQARADAGRQRLTARLPTARSAPVALHGARAARPWRRTDAPAPPGRVRAPQRPRVPGRRVVAPRPLAEHRAAAAADGQGARGRSA